MKLELINFYKLGTFTTAEEVKAYLLELELNSGWIVDFLQSLRNDFKAIEEKKKQVDAYKKNDEGVFLNRTEGLDAMRFQDAYNWLEVFKMYLSDKEKEYKYQSEFQSQYYSQSVKEFQKKLQKKYIADITEGWESLFDELKYNHEASLQLFDNKEQNQFVREEIDKLRKKIMGSKMPIAPKTVLNRYTRGLLKLYYDSIYTICIGVKIDGDVKLGSVVFDARSRFLRVKPYLYPLNVSNFHFKTLNEILVNYIAEIKFLEYLKKGGTTKATDWSELYNNLINIYIKDVSPNDFNEVMEFKQKPNGSSRIKWIGQFKSEAMYFQQHYGFTVKEFNQCFVYKDGRNFQESNRTNKDPKNEFTSLLT